MRGFIHGVGLSFEETPFPTIFSEQVLMPLATVQIDSQIEYFASQLRDQLGEAKMDELKKQT